MWGLSSYEAIAVSWQKSRRSLLDDCRLIPLLAVIRIMAARCQSNAIE